LKTVSDRDHESSLPILTRGPVTGQWRRWAILPVVAMSAAFSTEPRPVLDFRDPAPAAAWSAVDERVMGGGSASRAEIAPEGLVFHGTVSLAQGGGFASIRAQPRQYGLAGATAFVLRVQGDGRTYKFGVRTDDAFDGVQYQARFATRPGAWIDVELPVVAFQPTFRGRAAPDAPALDPARIRVFGLLIAERQAGPFRLVVESIQARF
jgi:NADH dehydrogenase [ubiquinone] 1 alpha subcomplex assembly factor 1